MMHKSFSIDFEFFDFFEAMCFIIDENGLIIRYNKSAERVITDQKANTLFPDFVEENEKQDFAKAMTSALHLRQSSNLCSKLRIGNKNIIAELFICPFTSFNNEKIRKECFVQVKDITQKKEREDELQRFFYVAENTVNPLQITDTEGKMIYVNPAFLKVSGYSRDELIGENPRIFGNKKYGRKFWTEMWDTIKSGKVWIGDVENIKKNGEAFHTQLLISPILDDQQNVTGYFGIHRDLSDKKTLEKQLIHTQKMESIGTLAAGIAHEVGNPLASISAIVQVAQRYTTDDSVKDKLELVKNQVNRISKIIRDLVDFSRPSNFELQLTDINKNISEAVEITKVGVKAKDVIFDMDLKPDIPRLHLVADQIQQVFVNILLNAADAILESQKKEKKIIIKSEQSHNNEVVITFKDTGTGISDENIPKIFEPFFTTKKEGKGTGLGLWVSYGIVKSFQGEIKVSSVYGQGTTFTIYLPIHN
ncbi:MAG: PAS domain S-box protein [Ignavibacteriaceae bacterium]|nr:PAS domain S-box protein [Ignavibacteriaceae bacterium]